MSGIGSIHATTTAVFTQGVDNSSKRRKLDVSIGELNLRCKADNMKTSHNIIQHIVTFLLPWKKAYHREEICVNQSENVLVDLSRGKDSMMRWCSLSLSRVSSLFHRVVKGSVNSLLDHVETHFMININQNPNGTTETWLGHLTEQVTHSLKTSWVIDVNNIAEYALRVEKYREQSFKLANSIELDKSVSLIFKAVSQHPKGVEIFAQMFRMRSFAIETLNDLEEYFPLDGMPLFLLSIAEQDPFVKKAIREAIALYEANCPLQSSFIYKMLIIMLKQVNEEFLVGFLESFLPNKRSYIQMLLKDPQLNFPVEKDYWISYLVKKGSPFSYDDPSLLFYIFYNFGSFNKTINAIFARPALALQLLSHILEDSFTPLEGKEGYSKIYKLLRKNNDYLLQTFKNANLLDEYQMVLKKLASKITVKEPAFKSIATTTTTSVIPFNDGGKENKRSSSSNNSNPVIKPIPLNAKRVVLGDITNV